MRTSTYTTTQAFGRATAFNVATGMWCVCGLLLLLLGGTMRADEEDVLRTPLL